MGTADDTGSLHLPELGLGGAELDRIKTAGLGGDGAAHGLDGVENTVARGRVRKGIAHNGGKLGEEGADLGINWEESCNQVRGTGYRAGGGQGDQGVGKDNQAGSSVDQQAVRGQKI